MDPGDRCRGLVIPAILVTVFVAQSLLAGRLKSPTWDEPAHIRAGLSYLQTGVVDTNLQHPPLLKEISALPLMLMSAEADETDRGDDFIAAETDRVLFWSRSPLALLAGLLAVAMYVWGCRLVGRPAALAALFLFAFSPALIAHSSLVTTDVGFAAFTTLFFFALWSYIRSPSPWRLVCSGLALGAVLSTKFSALLIPPIGALLLLAAVRWRPARIGRDLATCVAALAVMLAVALVVVQASYLLSNGPVLYWRGARLVNADHDTHYLYFLGGELGRRFLGYFVACYLLKEPLAAIALAFSGFLIVWRGDLPLLDKLFLLLPPAALLIAYTMWADDLGIRYLIPLLPFTYLLGGVAVARLLRGPSPWSRGVGAMLCAWVVVAAVGVYPDHLSYFNELACLPRHLGEIGFDGGSRCGPLWLDDHNVDWGQGLKQLKTWLDRNQPGRTVRLAYFGNFAPSSYGLRAELIGEDDLNGEPAPGLYAITAHVIARGPADARQRGARSWTEGARPLAIVGHAFYVYDTAPPQ